MKAIREYISLFLKWLLEKIEKQKETQVNVQNIVINTLAPKIITDANELKKIEPYLNNLKAAIDEKGINNIAITGGYGSGKSTILRTFQHKYSHSHGYEYLNISLASFQEESIEGDLNGEAKINPETQVTQKAKRNSKESDIERKLEISILQQMFYQVDPEEIPDSRFKRIVNLKWQKLLMVAFGVIIWVFSLFVLLKFNHWKKLDPISWSTALPFDKVTLITTLIVCVGVGLFSKKIYHLSKNAKINKLSIKGEIELGETVDKSIFNQYLEEILYFFERTPFNVVIIEDVDRFESTQIFTKLRELNILVNQAKSIKRHVKFVYAIRDDKFKDNNDRVKFFDFIIPIISFINPSNANEQLEKLISESKLDSELPPDFINDVLPFIDDIDMRLLLNIFQEYQIYRKILSEKLDQKKLFAILIYKNLQPKDFMELTKGRGVLYSFFSRKYDYIEGSKNELQKQIELLDIQIGNIENETSSSINELRAVYILKLISKLEKFDAFQIDGRVTPADAVNDKNFNYIKSSGECNYYKFSPYAPIHTTKLDVQIKDIEFEVNPNFTYDDRVSHIRDVESNRINSLKEERLKAIQLLQDLENMSIQEIFEQKEIIEYLEGFKEKPLMRSLLLNGYIGEDFTDYISLFHGISLTQSDHEFDRAVKSGVRLNYEHQLSKIDYLIGRMPERHFMKEAIWNFALLDFLLDKEHLYRPKLNLFLRSLNPNKEEHFLFIFQYIKKSPRSLRTFLNGVCDVKTGFWKYIVLQSGLPDDEIRELFRLIVSHVSFDKIERLENIELFDGYIKGIPDLFAFNATFDDKSVLPSIIIKRNIKINLLDTPSVEQQSILVKLYNGWHYEINTNNIKTILNALQIQFSEPDFKRQQYTTVLKLNVEPLHNYFREHLSDYVKNVLILEEENDSEGEDVLIEIINSHSVGNEIKRLFLNKQKEKINDIDSLSNKTSMSLAIETNVLAPTWNNVYQFRLESDIEFLENEESLKAFLNLPINYGALSKTKLIDIGADMEPLETFAMELLACESLSNDAYSALVSGIGLNFDKMELSKLSIGKIDTLITQRILNPSVANFESISAISQKLQIKFIELHALVFVNEAADWIFEEFMWVEIYNSKNIDDDVKFKFLQRMPSQIITESQKLREILIQLVKEIRLLDLPYEKLKALIANEGVLADRLEILLKYQNLLPNDSLTELIQSFGDDYRKIFDTQEEISFIDTPKHEELFQVLDERDMIGSYSINTGGYGAYDDATIRVIGKID